jgi:tetratricopeptide (TPR) repeat protein
MLLAYVAQQPVLLVGVLLFLVLRRYIPDPGAIWRALRRARSLRDQVNVNAANVTARRDLAVIYLDLRRPKAALVLVEQALLRDGSDPELLFLHGLALHRAGRHEEALAPLVRSVEHRAVRYGEPYRIAGDALLALGRIEEAIDAYEHYARHNHSDVAVHVQLARAHARAGDGAATRASLAKAFETWREIPSAMRRKSIGAWLEAHWLRARLLGDPTAIVAIVAIVAGLAVGVRALAPYLRDAFASSAGRRSSSIAMAAYQQERAALLEAFGRCGSESTGEFAGKYVIEALSPASTAELDATNREQYMNFEVKRDRIQSGARLVQEFCLTRVLERTPNGIRAEAVWHEDVNDPGDALRVEVRFERVADRFRFGMAELGAAPTTWISLRRDDVKN